MKVNCENTKRMPTQRLERSSHKGFILRVSYCQPNQRGHGKQESM